MNDWKVYMDRIGTPEMAFRCYQGIVRDNIQYLLFFHKLTSTSIWFYLYQHNYSHLLCVYFVNSNAKGWSGELRDLDFCANNIRKVDEFLRPALVTGWKSIDYYLMGRYFSSCVREKVDGSGKVIQKFTSYYKFWSYLLFPICLLMDRMILSGLIGKGNKVSVAPIKQKNNQKKSTLIALVYHSVASALFDSTQIKDLLEHARNFNKSKGITGCLLYYNGAFVQYIEGDRQVVNALFENIKRDHRHEEVRLLSLEETDDREFESWEMAYEDFLGKNDHLKFLELLLSSYVENPGKSLEPNPSSVNFWKTAKRILASRTIHK